MSAALDGSGSFATRVASPHIFKPKPKGRKDPKLGLDRLEEMKISDVDKFLVDNKTAKIIVVIDTHCMEESGSFVCSGGGDEQLVGCTLHQVCDCQLSTPELIPYH